MKKQILVFCAVGSFSIVGIAKICEAAPYTDDTWAPTSTTNAPVPRSSHTAVWTGNEMIIWGGFYNVGWVNTGGKYKPVTNSWMATSIANAASARYDHSAVWTGSEMVVWGGYGYEGYLNSGGRYNPSTNSWTPTSTTNALLLVSLTRQSGPVAK